jgi:AcrR family transcriptional regulator
MTDQGISRRTVMSKDRSKTIFAKALLELTNKKAMADITVTDITDYCGLSRTSFYYHFKDKQELIFWIYATFREKKIKLTVDHSRENIIALVTYMQQYHSFFKQAFAESGQNCFKNEYCQSLYHDTLLVMEEYNDCGPLDENSKKLIARFYASAMADAVEMLLDAPIQDIENAADVLTEILNCSWNVIERLKAARGGARESEQQLGEKM